MSIPYTRSHCGPGHPSQSPSCTAKLPFTKHRSVSALLFLFSIFSQFLLTTQQAIPIWLNASFSGTTNKAPRGIVSGFSLYDQSNTVGLGGQVVLELPVTAQPTTLTNLHISSCQGSTFETYLALLDNSPFSGDNATIIAESANDIQCTLDEQRAYLSTRLSAGTYYLLVTGLEAQQGKYNITVQGFPVYSGLIPWGLDRIDQRRLPLDGLFTVRDSGDDIYVYLIDSGVRASHEELKGRVTEGHDFINNKIASAPDCTGHGTHVAGAIAGTTYGVARKARIIAVRVFGCDNKARLVDIIDAVHWVMLNSKELSIRRSCVVALMFSSALAPSRSLRSAMISLRKSGIPVVVPSGDSGTDSCKQFPSSLDDFVSVGAAERGDFKISSSNFGNCTDIYAPGDSILSSWHTSDTASREFSGTGPAAAHMAGIVAVLASLNRGVTAEIVKSVLKSISTENVVKDVPGDDSTRFAFVRSIPNVPMDIPDSGEVYIFTILQLELGACNQGSAQALTLRKVFGETLSISSDDVVVNCTEPLYWLSTQQSLTPLTIRFELDEREATTGFKKLEEALDTGKSAVESKLGFSFTVAQQPWAIASNRFIYWGVPTFFDSQSRGLSKGVIAGIAAGAILGVLLCVIVVWLCYRRSTTLDRVDSMEGSADLEKSPVTFDNPAPDGTGNKLKNLVRGMSFRKTGLVRVGSTASVSSTQAGLIKTGSIVETGDGAGARDVFRLSSFGGEAFAQVAAGRMDSISDNGTGPAVSREMSLQNIRLQGLAAAGRMESQTGHLASPYGGQGAVAMRLDSVGGEAFASVATPRGGKGDDDST